MAVVCFWCVLVATLNYFLINESRYKAFKSALHGCGGRAECPWAVKEREVRLEAVR
jgi:hypothetical protein